ncbi:MAG: hypothetical protein GY913_06755 [Proteobacteria bacterium]|nr:hypothetical protein [Pseudomonadota bacterium]MCP4916606.1 hypothetical protein [Pseudomonadota bacterium]
MSALLVMMVTAWGAEVHSGDDLTVDVGGDVKTFVNTSFPYEHVLMPEDPSGQGIVDFRLKTELRYKRLLVFKAHHATTLLVPGSTTSTASTGVGIQAPEALPLSWEAYDTDGLVLRGRMDRLSATLRVPHADITLGRQPLSFGKTSFFTPLDLVSPFNPAVVDQEYRPGVDAARLDLYAGMATQLTLAAAYADDWDREGMVFSAYGQTTLGVWDLGLFAGHVRGDQVYGLATAGSLGPVGITGEGTITLPDQDDVDPFVRAALGGFVRPGPKTTVSAEAYVQTLREADPDTYLLGLDDPRYERGELWLMGRYYGGLAISQEITPTVFGNVAVIGNVTDPSALIAPSLSWSLAQNADLSVSGFFGVGERPDDVELEDLFFMTEDEAAAIVNSEFGLVPAAGVVRLAAYF